MRPTSTPLALAAALALAVPAAASAHHEHPARSGGWSVELVDESGAVLPTFEHRGRTWVLGTKGRRYAVHVRNGTGSRVEVVVSVDGRDAVDGRPSSLGKRGYVIDPWDEATIDGFRLSDASVAAFRFGSVDSSYAARMGDARDVGVVGVAVFGEAVRWTPPPPPYDAPHRSYDRRDDAAGEAAPAPGASAGAVPPSAAPAPEASASAAPRRKAERPGLGTDFGEERASAVSRVGFERASATPAAVLTLRYDDRAGLVAQGIDVDRGAWARRDEAWRRESADPFRRDAAYSVPPPGWRR